MLEKFLFFSQLFLKFRFLFIAIKYQKKCLMKNTAFKERHKLILSIYLKLTFISIKKLLFNKCLLYDNKHHNKKGS